MNLSKQQLKILVASIVVLPAIGFLLLFSYNRLVFQVVEVKPDPETLPTSSSRIEVVFNKELSSEQNSSEKVSLQPPAVSNVSFTNNSVVIQLQSQPQSGTTLDISLENIQATNGDTLSETITLNVEYVPFGQIPEEEQNRQIQETDAIENQYPLITSLPLVADNYDIDYRPPDRGSDKLPVIIGVNSSPFNRITGEETEQSRKRYRQDLRKYRKQAIEYLKRNGFSRDKYRLYFEERELIDEFEGQHISEL